MQRKCTLYQTSEIYPRCFCVDIEHYDAIMEYVNQNEKYKKKFDYILGRILDQQFQYYDGYQLLTGYNDITEMRFFPNGDNGRIYCKEIQTPNGIMVVIASVLLPKKKTMKIDKAIKQIIEPLNTYEYEIIED